MGCSLDLGDIKVKQVKDVEVEHVKDVEVEHVKDVEVEHVKNIGPIAAHIKEVNNIDPLSVDAFNVTQVTNIDPLRVREFNVTNLPTVNVCLRQLPPLEMNLRRLAPLSVGFHQDFHIPSDYSVRLHFLGLEVARVAVQGQTRLIPREKYRREQARTHERSFPQPAVAGNPAIPSHLHPTADRPAFGCGWPAQAPTAGTSPGQPLGGLAYGGPAASFSLPKEHP
jgi:hypothetical protein